jgi:hypothetical protein
MLWTIFRLWQGEDTVYWGREKEVEKRSSQGHGKAALYLNHVLTRTPITESTLPSFQHLIAERDFRKRHVL